MWKSYILLIAFVSSFQAFFFIPNGFAETYHIRPYDFAKLNGDGTSPDWASEDGQKGCWNGLEGAKSANWTTKVGGGDTVYFIGTFIRERKGRGGVFDVDFPSGGNDQYVEFRGDHSDGYGILTNFIKDSAPGGLNPENWDYIYRLEFDRGSSEPHFGATVSSKGSASGYVTFVHKSSGDWLKGDAAGAIYIWKKSGTFNDNDPIQINGSIQAIAVVKGGDAKRTNTYFNKGFKISDNKGLFEYFNSISDYQELTKKKDAISVLNGKAGDYFYDKKSAYWINPYNASNLSNNNIRFSGFPGYRLRMDRDGDYIRFYRMNFYGDAPSLNKYHAGESSEYVEWKECYFWRTPAFRWPAGTFNQWTWTGNVHDGDGFVSAGHIYNTCVRAAKSVINNWLIENSYFGGVHKGSDSHALGFQGNANNVKIRYNTITDCGSGIVLWKGSCGTQNNFWITHNYIYELNGAYESKGKSKCHGIVMQGGKQETRQGIVIAHNVLRDPMNCDYSADDYHGIGIRTVSKSGYHVKVYNNTIKNYPVSFEFEGNSRDNDVDFRNNISLTPGFYHVHTNGYSTNSIENYNCYYANSDDKMWYHAKKGVSVIAYNDAVKKLAGVTVNTNTITSNPKLNDDMIPDDITSPVVNSGVNVGYEYLLGKFIWPNKAGGSGKPLTSFDSHPEIGAYALDTK